MKKKILVTGGAGYIGSITTELLVSSGLEPVVLDNLVEGHGQAIPRGVPVVEADLTDAEAVRRAFTQFDIAGVFHLAGLIAVGESVAEPARYYRHNVVGMLNLLDTMLERGVKRIIFSSSAAVYGTPQEMPIREECTPGPVNPYGWTKLIGEELLKSYRQTYGLAFAALRYFNVAGATAERGENHRNESHLVPRVLQVALGQRPHVEIYGTDYPTPDGTCVRDYIHVSDVAEAHLLAWRRLDSAGGIYNLGDNRGYTVREVIQAAEKVTGKKILFAEHGRRAGDAPVLVASFEKIARELGWRPRCSDLEEIISSAWQWHSCHPHGYGS